MFGIAGYRESNAESPRLKIAIVGEPKTGKSWLASTAPEPVFVADFDDRAESILGRPDVHIKTYVDVGSTSVRAIADFDADLGKMEYTKKSGGVIPNTIVLDSATYMRKFIEQGIIKDQSSLGRTIKIGANQIKIGQGWDIINGVRAEMEYFIARCAAIANVIVVFHEQDEKDTSKSTETKKVYTGRTTIQPQYLSSILSVFNEVWRITIEKDKYVVSVKQNDEFLASTTMELDAQELPDIKAMIEKSRQRKVKKLGA